MANLIQKLFSFKPKTNLKPAYYSDSIGSNFAKYFHLDTDEVANKNGGRAYYKRLLQDDEIYSAFSTRKDGTLESSWEIIGDNEVQVQELKEIFSEIYHDAVNYSLDALFYGYAGLELNYSGDYFYLKRVPIEAFTPTPDFKMAKNNLSMFWGDSSRGFLDEEKYFLVVNNQGVDNVLGEALGSKLYYLYQYKCNTLDYYANALRKFGTPYLVAFVDDPALELMPNKSKAEVIGEALAKANQGSGIVLGKDEQLTKIDSSGGQHFKEALEYFSEKIQKVILGQTLAQDSGTYGSYAQAKIHRKILDAKISGDKRLIQPTINSVINQIAKIKGFNSVRFKFSNSEVDYSAIERDEKLYAAGVRFNEDYFSSVYNLDKSHFSVDSGSSFFNKPFSLSRKYDEKDFEEDVKAFQDRIAEGSPLNEFENEYRKAIANSNSFDDLGEKLKKINPKNKKLFNYVLGSLFLNRILGANKYDESVKD